MNKFYKVPKEYTDIEREEFNKTCPYCKSKNIQIDKRKKTSLSGRSVLLLSILFVISIPNTLAKILLSFISFLIGIFTFNKESEMELYKICNNCGKESIFIEK